MIFEAPGLIEYIDVADHGIRASACAAEARDAADYRCTGCGHLLFNGEDGIVRDAGDAFFAPVDPAVLTQHAQCLDGARSVELRCATCDSHVGHVFPDGPWPTGLRYQIDAEIPIVLDS